MFSVLFDREMLSRTFSPCYRSFFLFFSSQRYSDSSLNEFVKRINYRGERINLSPPPKFELFRSIASVCCCSSLKLEVCVCVCVRKRGEREREGGKYKITYVVYLYQGQWLDERGEPRKVNLTGEYPVEVRSYPLEDILESGVDSKQGGKLCSLYRE